MLLIGVIFCFPFLSDITRSTPISFSKNMDLSDAMILYKDINHFQDCNEEIKNFEKFKKDKQLPCEFNVVINNTAFDLEHCLEFQMEIVMGEKLLTTIDTSVCNLTKCILQEVKGKCDVSQDTQDIFDTSTTAESTPVSVTNHKTKTGEAWIIAAASLSSILAGILIGIFFTCLLIRGRTFFKRYDIPAQSEHYDIQEEAGPSTGRISIHDDVAVYSDINDDLVNRNKTITNPVNEDISPKSSLSAGGESVYHHLNGGSEENGEDQHHYDKHTSSVLVPPGLTVFDYEQVCLAKLEQTETIHLSGSLKDTSSSSSSDKYFVLESET